MSRRSVRTTPVVAFALALAAVGFGSAPAAAQAPPRSAKTGHFELVQGLRDAGMPDLALEYLDEKVTKDPAVANDPAVKAELPLERARTQLELAELETEDGKRSALVTQAKKGFEDFIKTAPASHPRLPEANIALGRLTSLAAKSALARAATIKDKNGWKTAAAATRPEFEKAVAKYKAAVTVLSNLMATATGPEKARLEREKIDAEFQTAVAQYEISRTYVDHQRSVDEVKRRGDAITEAIKLFNKITETYPTSPTAGIARAWVGECYLAIESPNEAKAAFDSVLKTLRSPAGIRTMRFFEARRKYLDLGKGWSDKAAAEALVALNGWLTEYNAARQTNEHHALRYYYGRIKQMQGERGCTYSKDDPPKLLTVPPTARENFRAAERAYARVAATDNEFSDLANERRTQAIRMIVGTAKRNPKDITDFSEAAMAARVQLDHYFHPEKDEKPEESLLRVIALLEHALTLPPPAAVAGGPDHSREVADTKLQLIFAYTRAGRNVIAAVYADGLARSSRGAVGAKAGMYGIQAYLTAMNKYTKDNAGASATADRDRIIALAAYMDKEFPADPSTDAARIVLGQVLNGERKYKEAFDILTRVSPASPKLGTARLMEGVAAYSLLRATEGVTPEQKAAIFQRVMTDLQAVPEPLGSASADDAAVYIRLRLLLCQLHTASGAAGFAPAEQAAVAAAALIGKFPSLSPEERMSLQFSAEENRLRAVYGQVFPLYRDGKYDEVMTRLNPILGDIAASFGDKGSAVRTVESAKDFTEETKNLIRPAAERLDDFRREAIIVLALQTAIRKADVPAAKDLYAMLKGLGGSTESSVKALTQLVGFVKPQIDQLRREKKEDDAKKLIAGVSALLGAVSSEKDITPSVRVFLGKALKDIGAYDEAAKALAAIPKPSPADLALTRAQLDELNAGTGDEAKDKENKARRLGVVFYRGAQIELARALRLGKKFDDADRILKDAMGDDKTPGWAKNAPDFKKEVIYLLEDKAENSTDPKAAAVMWRDAAGAWSKFSGEYRPMMQTLAGAKGGPKQAMLGLLKIKQPLPPHELLPKKTAEITDTVIKEEKAPWVVALLAPTATIKDEDGLPKDVPNPYHGELQAVIKRLESTVKPLFYDAFFEYNRCIARANTSMLKGKPNLADQHRKLAEKLKELQEKNPDLSPDVQAKFTDLLEDYPELDKQYKAIGGKPFQSAPPPANTPPVAGN